VLESVQLGSSSAEENIMSYVVAGRGVPQYHEIWEGGPRKMVPVASVG